MFLLLIFINISRHTSYFIHADVIKDAERPEPERPVGHRHVRGPFSSVIFRVDDHIHHFTSVFINEKIFEPSDMDTLGVDDETEAVNISGASYKPQSEESELGESRKVINLEAELWSSYKDKAYLAFDKEGNEISPDQVPSAPSEDCPERILEEFNRNREFVLVSPEKGLELVRSKVVKRPSDAATIKNELFLVSEHAMIYCPIYEITFHNVKSGEEKIVKIDGVTAKIVS